MSDARRGFFRNARDDHSAVAVSDQNYIVQIFIFQHAKHVLNMNIKPDIGVQQMLALSKFERRASSTTRRAMLRERINSSPYNSPAIFDLSAQSTTKRLTLTHLTG